MSAVDGNNGNAGNASSTSDNVLSHITKSIKLPSLNKLTATSSPIPFLPPSNPFTDILLKSPQVPRIISGDGINYISTRFEQIMSEYLSAVTLGAMLGAAVTTGVIFGTLAASGAVSSIKALPSLWSWAIGADKGTSLSKRDDMEGRSENFDDVVSVTKNNDTRKSNNGNFSKRGDNEYCLYENYRDNYENEEKQHQSSSEINNEQNGSVSLVYVGEAGPFTIIRGDVKPFRGVPVSSINQCRECLDSLGVLLGKHDLRWNDVRKLTVYLMVDQCNASVFRNVLREYPLPTKNVVTTVLYVQRLEDEYAVVQVEAFAIS
mmetsp:Transcript_65405/g.77422  ORF Transcript_65405/g.77422 Transcript_65405/m.77422 type:complete len:319 (-) Transcript_65405:195-1151(-)|eukprot:CAMPEP_0172503242 /NCGR_PEP_ID=MMETSP1066-20121228/167529_1 /TAXON_ID=671091 /ORGANISM="Coscinodiscus wailesii, Strain CCMP2513" /LENGTH=318 /DNA_ID=CAMNT_0013278901 /DNA_START=70 /DNA_END=1026 /DNA_ORIENTATION=+